LGLIVIISKFEVKKKVLKHHPDKKKSRENQASKLTSNEDYFSCITKAGDVLSNQSRRRAYDSVDSSFDDIVPAINSNNKANFFEVFPPVIESNAR
jgi:DnaJ family protein C protein 2